MKNLYAIDNKGKIRIWSIRKLYNGLLIKHGTLNGATQEKFEEITKGLAARTIEEQINSRYLSRINKKIDSGYCETLIEAQEKPRANSLGFQKPMLAAKFNDCKDINYNDLYIQYKYDGNRMLVKNENGVNVAYTRNGKIINTIPEIIKEMEIPNGMTIDGEIYCHGESLQTIVSWVKRRQNNSLKLRYHVYDIMLNEHYHTRFSILSKMNLGKFSIKVPTYKYSTGNGKSIKELLNDSIALGYEGLILRQNEFGYESGKRSKSLIKVKKFFDDEFLIIGVHLSKDGIPMLNLITDNGIEFKATIPGTMDQKHFLYNRTGLINKYAYVEYSQLTKALTPFHPICIKILNQKNELK